MTATPPRDDDLLIPVRNETVAATRFESTVGDGPKPVILNYDPYHKDDFSTYQHWYTDVRYLTAHGYDVVIADMVGSGASTGGTKGLFTPEEGKEGAEIVDWLANRDWSTGRVGMIGMSYSGVTALKTAAEGPDALDAIVPSFAASSYEGIYPGGVVFLYLTMSWNAMMQTFQAMPPTRRDPDGRWADIWRSRLDDLRTSTPFFFEGIDHESKDEFWRRREIPTGNIEVPTFSIAGWRDPYHQDTIEYLREIDAPTRLVLGPWRHERPHLGREARIDARRQTVEWFDHFLKDEPTGILHQPEVTYWTERFSGGRLDEGAWRTTDRWPEVGNRDIDSLEFVLSEGLLVKPDEFEGPGFAQEYPTNQTVGIDSMDTHTPNATSLDEPVDTSADDARSLCFETDRLAVPVELTGTGDVTLRVTPSIPDPLVAVRLVDVGPFGKARLVSTGRLRLRHRDDLTTPSAVTPGETYTVSVPLTPKSHVFEERHRIRLAVSGAFFPMVLPGRQQGTLTVHSTPENPSTVRIPGREHPGGFEPEDVVSMGRPDESLPLRSPYITLSETTMETTREHLENTATFDIDTTTAIEPPSANRVTRSEHYSATVQARDPGTAVCRHDGRVTIEYDTETVLVETRAHGSRDTGGISTRVTIDETPVFDETWTR